MMITMMMCVENNCPAIYALGVEASTPSAPCAGPCMIGVLSRIRVLVGEVHDH